MKTTSWDKLDNAAKIFPVAASGTNTQVYRVSCELFEPIDPDILQRSLDETLSHFELYRCVLRRGLFWYYLENRNLQAAVAPESNYPCRMLYNKQRPKLLFEVTYYGSRINFEAFHVLADGTGAVQFMKMLVNKYLSIKYGFEEPPVDYDASPAQMENDSFSQYYNDTAYKKAKPMPEACQLRGQRYSEDRLKIIIGRASMQSVKEAAKKYSLTVTDFLCALLIQSVIEEIPVRSRRKPVVIAVPVNLRRFFPSLSARNFFTVVYPSYNFYNSKGTFEDIAEKVAKSMKENLTFEKMSKNLNEYAAAEHNIIARISPLRLKDIILKRAYKKSLKTKTASLSNVGIINMPKTAEKYIRSFDIVSGTNALQLCVVTFGDKMSFGFSTPFTSADTERCFFRKLLEHVPSVEIESNFDE